MKIKDIKAEEIKDSRGNSTLKVIIVTENSEGSFEVPSGASTGIHEAHELRDEDGGVQKAIKATEEIKEVLLGMDVSAQEEIDKKMIQLDGTQNKERLGGNSLIGVSIACARASAKEKSKELHQYLKDLKEIKPSKIVPYLYMNLINGGVHTKNGSSFQEYMIVPQVEDVSLAIKIGQKVFSILGEDLPEKFGDEGGYAIETEDVIEPLKVLKKAVQKAGYEDKIKFALDVAASSFYKDGKYEVGNKELDAQELKELYLSLDKEFPIISIEDPFNEEDFERFTQLQNETDIIIIGDDLTVTNKERLQKAIDQKSIRGIIIKPNQIGTLTETLETIRVARDNDIECIVSHRSGETKDSFIADLTYAFGCFGLKSGALNPPERMAKYDRLSEIVGRDEESGLN